MPARSTGSPRPAATSSLVLLALGGWADRHQPSERPSDLRFVDADGGARVEVAAVGVDSSTLVPRERIAARLEQ